LGLSLPKLGNKHAEDGSQLENAEAKAEQDSNNVFLSLRNEYLF
jgi:hypothetical protein